MNEELSRLDILDGIGRHYTRAQRQNRLRRTPVVGGSLSFSDLTEAYPATLLDVTDPYKPVVRYNEPYPVSGDLTAKYESRSHNPWPIVNLWRQPGVLCDDEFCTYCGGQR